MKVNNIQDHFDRIASSYDDYKRRNWYYYRRLKTLLQRFIPPGKRVLEVGCGTGEVLVCLAPSFGVGIDVSSNMIEIARKKHTGKRMRFITADIVSFRAKKEFDYLCMADVVEHLSDPEKSFAAIRKCMGIKTLLVNVMANPLWEPILIITEKIGLKMPEGEHYRVNFAKIEKILESMGLEVVTHGYDTLCPIYIPLFAERINRYIAPYFARFNIFEYFVAKVK